MEVAIAQLARHEKQQAIGPAAFQATTILVKGTVSRDFLLLVFFLNQFPPSL